MKKYPVLKDDIYYAKIQTPSGIHVKIRNTTTEKDFNANDATVALLDLCDGSRSVDEIITELSILAGEPAERIAQGVYSILAVLEEKDTITIRSTPLKRHGHVKEITVNHPLKTAQIEITNKCNLSCAHCVNASGPPLPNELTTKEILSLIDTLSAMGVDNLTLSGGEPLLHPDIFEIAEYARKAPMSVNIFSNGTIITEKDIEQCNRVGVNRFLISIDSMDPTIHDTFRGQKGALKKTLHAINLLKEAQFSIIPAVAVSQVNKNSITGILEYFKDNNFTEYQVAPVIFSGRGNKSIAVTPHEYYTVLVDQFTYCLHEFPEGIQHINESDEHCGIGVDRIGFKPDGTILPCPGCVREMGVGNIKNTDLVTFWDKNDQLNLFRTMKVETDTLCSGCQYLRFCVGCVLAAFSFERVVRCYDPYSCALLRAYDTVIGLE